MYSPTNELEDDTENPQIKVVPFNPFMTGCIPPPLHEVYIFNFPTGIDELHLKKFLEHFGKVRSISPRTHCWDTSCPDRYIIVTFEDEEAYRRILTASKSELLMGGNTLHVVKCGDGHGPDIPMNNGKYFVHISADYELKDCQLLSDKLSLEKRKYSINDLNDKCLIEIFSHIGLAEKIKLESVCKRWKTILLHQWKTISYLDFKNQNNNLRLTNCLLARIIQRCGKSIKEIDLPDDCYSVNGWNYQLIASSCKLLTGIRTTFWKFTLTDACYLTSNCKNLKSLDLRSSWQTSDEVYELLFKELQLKSLITSVDDTSCRFLCRLPPTMEYLDLQGVSEEKGSYLGEGLQRALKLKILKLDRCHPFSYSSLGSLPSKYILEELSVCDNMRANSNNLYLSHVLGFENLRKLCVRSNDYVNDQFLTRVALKCKKLQVLDVTDCNGDNEQPVIQGVTDIGIIAIASGTNLRSLNISGLFDVTNESLYSLGSHGKLTKLICERCPKINSAGLSSLVSSSPRLESLNIANNEQFTDEIISIIENAIFGGLQIRKIHLILSANQMKGKTISSASKKVEVEIKDDFLTF